MNLPRFTKDEKKRPGHVAAEPTLPNGGAADVNRFQTSVVASQPSTLCATDERRDRLRALSEVIRSTSIKVCQKIEIPDRGVRSHVFIQTTVGRITSSGTDKPILPGTSSPIGEFG